MPRKKKEEVAVENTEIVEAAVTVAPTEEAPAPKKRGGRRKKADAESVEEKAKDAIFNLAGQQVDKTFKGVVIKNGKKMIQK